MNRYHSDSDDEYSNHHRQSGSAHKTGWQTPSSYTKNNTSGSQLPSSIKRIVVDSPFGLNKCDYSIDRSQPGRLVVTARRPRGSSSSGKNRVAVQTFTIPSDADVDRLQSHTDKNTNRLIIEIPRRLPSATNRPSRTSAASSTHIARHLIRSPDVERMLTSPTGGPQLVRETGNYGRRNSSAARKLEYRVDCHGYAADELDVFIQGRDLIVQGKTRTSTSTDPKQQRVSKKFSRKISLPNTVDLPRVVSYLQRGELRIEAPLKPGVYYSDEEIILPGPPPTTSSSRAATTFISNLEKRTRSPAPVISSSSNNRYHYRRKEQGTGRRRDYDRSPNRRVRSVDATRYPLFISPRELDEEDDRDEIPLRETRRQSNGIDERHVIYRKQIGSRPSSRRSIYSQIDHPTSNATRNRSLINHNTSDDENYLRF